MTSATIGALVQVSQEENRLDRLLDLVIQLRRAVANIQWRIYASGGDHLWICKEAGLSAITLTHLDRISRIFRKYFLYMQLDYKGPPSLGLR